MDKSWLTEKLTIEEAEERFIDQDDRIDPEPVPFGFNHYHWINLKAKMKVDDELWLFSSPKETWLNMCGRGGVCILRKGEVIDSMVTIMN